jgi:hypothetical protein
MGRHSASDEPEVEVTDGSPGTDGAAGSAVTLDLAARLGRHSRDDAVDDSHTQRIAVITDAPIEDRHDTDVIAPIEAPLAAEPVIGPPGVAPGIEPDADTDTDTKARKAAEKARARAEKAAGKSQQQGDKAAAKAERKTQRRESGTRADLRMLRHNGAVRAQALAAVIVSFLLYTVVMVVIGDSGSYLQWLWIPIVASGVLVGLVLDLAHRRANKPPTS